MNLSRIIQRSFEITWGYRALWVFGIIMALTTVGNSGVSIGNSGGGGGGHSFAAPSGLASKVSLPLTQIDKSVVIALAAAAVVLILLVTEIFAVAHLISETALIRMVDGYETSGTRVSVSQGFRLGWSRNAMRIFEIDLLVFMAAVLTIILLLAVAAAPLLLWTLDSKILGILGTSVSVMLGILVLIIIIGEIIALMILTQFFHRAVVLEGLGVFESLRRGWQMARMRLSETLLLAVTLFAIDLGFSLILSPVHFLLLAAGGVLAGLPGLLIGLLTSLFAQGIAPWIAGIIVAAPILFIVIIVPILFTSGLFQVFSSSAWTLAYRDLQASAAAPSVPSA